MKFTFAPESRPLEGYTIKRAIYRGGFGEVYYALTDAGREVALKLLQNNTEVELRGVQQCLNLSHPNLVTIFDIRRDAEGDHWILMEYVAGETLDAALRRYPSGMPMEEVRRWLPGLAAGVSFLHDRGIVHRDLKPANVFIENGVVKVGDVGLSKFITPSRRSAHTQSVGTVYYMAPEVAKGKYGREVDVYAIGVILYEMVTGRVPFDGESTGEILMKHLSERPDLSVLPPRIAPVIGKALEKDPARRYSSVTELAEAFERAVLGKSAALEIPEAAFVATHADSTPVPCHVRRHCRPEHHRPRSMTCGRPGPLGGTGVWLVGGLIGLLLLPILGVREAGIIALLAVALGIIRSARSTASAIPRPVAEACVPQAGAGHPVVGTIPACAPPPVARSPGEEGPHRRRGLLTPRTVRSIAWRDRCAQFVDSAILATVLTTVFTAALFAVDFFAVPGVRSPVQVAGMLGQFAGTTLIAAWSILALTNLLEGRGWPSMAWRLLLLLIGCGVGVAAWGLAEFLFVTLREPADAVFTSVSYFELRHSHNPTWLGYVMFFGPLFGVRRWWWHADSYRPRRFRLMSVLLTMLCAGVLTTIWVFPHVWGIVWAGVISCVVQLSSPWTSPAARIRG